MTTRYPTADEWVAALSNMKDPIVIVEGEDDVRICAWAEGSVNNRRLDIHPAGGRKTLLEVYERRNEYPDVPVAFVADKDLWLFSGIPPDYPDIIWTEGYSIENDLYAGANLENLLNADEAKKHRQVLDSIIEWFAFEVEEHLAGGEPQVNIHCNRVVRPGKTEMDQDFCTCRGFHPPNEALHQQIRSAYQLQLRGKTLFQVLVRFLSAANRRPKHSTSGLYEFAVKMTSPQPLIDRLIDEIERTIAGHTPPN